ncbi:MAG TPA: prepilin-type N-terminal cleavage/methylation domain-containing protein [Candidatus Paceibacterota bacterium]|nr:prepilin-type N-terminal cleavage/methylation domain-containing protein [Candidatus Paceibacterota bacterium]
MINSRKGQTLVEALIALSILMVGFVGIVTLLTKSFQLNRTTADDTQATYLAAEGIEIVKNLIDHDVYEQLGGNGSYSWGSCFPYAGAHYYFPIDYTTTSCAGLSFQSGAPNTKLYFNPTTHLYSNNPFAATATDFVRNIKVTNNGQSIDVQSSVTWSSGALGNTITLEDIFYHYQP